jgi:hypothetical protein
MSTFKFMTFAALTISAALTTGPVLASNTWTGAAEPDPSIVRNLNDSASSSLAFRADALTPGQDEKAGARVTPPAAERELGAASREQRVMGRSDSRDGGRTIVQAAEAKSAATASMKLGH